MILTLVLLSIGSKQNLVILPMFASRFYTFLTH